MNLPVCLLAVSLVLVGWATDPAAATAVAGAQLRAAGRCCAML